ncbi:MAG: hypothetical protein RLZZ153_406 [Pseudomonadota bacterium]
MRPGATGPCQTVLARRRKSVSATLIAPCDRTTWLQADLVLFNRAFNRLGEASIPPTTQGGDFSSCPVFTANPT